jgi:Raf kinase inhibitor-like YbhB/YbcL family protein
MRVAFSMCMRTSILGLPFLLLAAAPASTLAGPPVDTEPASATLEVYSSAFGPNQLMPTEFTCEGIDVSPPLSWSSVPAGTRSIAILVEDPDGVGGTFTHWLVTGIPPTTTALDKGAALPEGAIAAKNDKGLAGYAGPCPASGTHRYRFRVYALDFWPGRPMTRSELLAAVPDHVLASGELVGWYHKQADRY